MEPGGRGRVGGADVDDDLVAFAGGAVTGESGEGGVGHADEGVGPGDPGWSGVGFGVGVAGVELGVPAGFEAFVDEGAELGVEVGAEVPAAGVVVAEGDLVAVVPVIRRDDRFGFVVSGGWGLEGVLACDLVELAHGGDPGEGRQLLVVGGRDVTHDLAHLVLRQRTGLEGGGGRRELGVAAGHGDEPLGPLERHAGLPGQPVRGGADARLLPRPAGQHLGHDPHQRGRRGVQQPDQLGHPRLDRVDLRTRRPGRRATSDVRLLLADVIEHVFDLMRPL